LIRPGHDSAAVDASDECGHAAAGESKSASDEIPGGQSGGFRDSRDGDDAMAAVVVWIRTLMLRVIRWALARLGELEMALDPPKPPTLTALQIAAREHVRDMDWKYPSQNGEYKRHKVFSRLMKQFPHERPRDLAFAIEEAVRTL
jgi:hypothetical protein